MAKDLQIKLLVQGCRQGNQASQMSLYEHFFSYGMGVCLRYSKSRDEALEIVNDGFLKAFLKIDQYDSEQPFKPWLRRILINASIDYYRKYNKHIEYLDVEYEQENYNGSFRKLCMYQIAREHYDYGNFMNYNGP